MKQSLKDTFIPHAGNDYAPHALQKVAVGLMAILILFTFASANVLSQRWIASDWMVSTVLPAVVVKETNAQRQSSALGGLQQNPVLAEAAQLKADHMATNGYFSHYSPEGVSPWFWFGQVNYNYAHAGENLAVHFADSKEVVDAWMNSPTHRANILNGDYTEIGIGTAKGTYEGFPTVFVVQLFGTPAAVINEPAVVGTMANNQGENPVLAETPAGASMTAPLPQSVEPTEASTTQVSGEAVTLDLQATRVTDTPPAIIVDTKEDAAAVDTVPVLVRASSTPTTSPEISDRLSHFISTSSGALPATTAPTAGSSENVSAAAELVTQPQTLLQYMYLFLAALVVSLLLLSVVIEWRRQQPLQIAYAFSLLFLMGGLWYTHMALLSNGVVL